MKKAAQKRVFESTNLCAKRSSLQWRARPVKQKKGPVRWGGFKKEIIRETIATTLGAALRRQKMKQ